MADESPGIDAAPAPGPPDRLIRLLWQAGAGGRPPEVFALVDAAREPHVYPLIRRSKLDHRCLFLGKVHPRLARAAPYLIHLGQRSPFTRELLAAGWGRSWGIFVRSAVILQDLRRHFRRFLQVRDEEGRKLFFRFYDPRVLRVYLPTCNRGELEYVFGPVDAYLLEDAEGRRLLRYSLERGRLRQDAQELEDAPAPRPG